MSEIQIRQLSHQGLAEFRSQIYAHSDPQYRRKLRELRSNETYLTPLSKQPFSMKWTLDLGKPFKNKFELGKYLFETLGDELLSEPFFSNQGLWSWIALCYFEQLEMQKKSHGDEHRFILSKNQSDGYRHLIRMPYLAYTLHKAYSFVILDGPLHVIGGTAGDRFARTWHFSNQALFEAMYSLYVKRDRKSGNRKIKRGAKSHVEAGSLRRLSKVVNQLELTFDLRSMNAEEILELLPAEFDRYKGKKTKPPTAPELRLASQPSLIKTETGKANE